MEASRGTFHETTKRAGQSKPDEIHLTVKVRPGGMRVHIYADNVGKGSAAFENVRMKGESVVNRGLPRQCVTA